MKKILKKKDKNIIVANVLANTSRVGRNVNKLTAAQKDGRRVRFNYIDQAGNTVKNVLANVNYNYNTIAGDTIFEFGILRTESSTAHPGFRPLRASKIRNVRVLK